MNAGVVGLVIGFVIFGVAIYLAWQEWSWWSFAYIAGAFVINKILTVFVVKAMAKQEGVDL